MLWTPSFPLVIVPPCSFCPGRQPKPTFRGFFIQSTKFTDFPSTSLPARFHAIDPIGQIDFGGGEYVAAGRIDLAAHQLRPEDKYLWWELDRGSYFIECNETLQLAPDEMALIEPEDRLLRAGGWHVPLFVRGHVAPLELLLEVGAARLRVKENARIARVRLFRIDTGKIVAKTPRKSSSSAPKRKKRKKQA